MVLLIFLRAYLQLEASIATELTACFFNQKQQDFVFVHITVIILTDIIIVHH